MADNHIKVGGAWKAIDDCSVKVGGAWKQVDNIYVKVAGAWKTVWTYLVISMTTIILQNIRGSGICVTYVKFGADGDIYESDETGAYGAATDTWLDAGAAADAYMELSQTGDALTQDDTGGGRVQMNTDRVVGITSAAGTKTATVEFRFYDAATGGTLIHTSSGNVIEATRT